MDLYVFHAKFWMIKYYVGFILNIWNLMKYLEAMYMYVDMY